MDGEVGSVFGKTESSELRAGRSGRTGWSQTALAAAMRAHPAAATTGALVGLAVVSTVLRSVIVGQVHGPFVFMDELGYERMALSFAHTGHFSLFGKAGLAYSPLYPIILSPIYALTSSMHTAYEWAKVENAVLISLAVFPIYGIARSVLSRRRAVGVAALSLVAPLMLYSGFEMSESLAYPLCLVALWTMLRTVRNPSLRNDALLLAAIVVASAARLQQVALFPAALTAILLVALARPEYPGSRVHSVLRATSRHRLLFGTFAVALVAVLARMAMNGGDLPLAGRYANVGTSQASPLRVFELFFQHLAELDWAVGVIPFAAALLAGYAVMRLRFPRSALVFASVAVASTFWLLLEVAYDAAAFDAAGYRPHTSSALATDLPRIHERYLIYVVPLFLVALFAVLGLRRASFPAPRHLVGVAVTAALLPALIPFGTVINGTVPFDSFALLLFGTTQSGRTVANSNATLLILVLSALLAFVYLLAASRQLPPPAAVLVTAVVFIALSSLELGNQVAPTGPTQFGLPVHADWIDRTVGGRGKVSLVGGAGVRRITLSQTAFWNASIVHVYYTCNNLFGTAFGERQLTLDRKTGDLRSASGTVRTRYAVVPASLGVSGHVLARDSAGKLVLVAPAGGTLRLSAGRSSALRCTG